MGFLRLTAEGVEEAARSETDTVAFTLYRLFPDYKWLENVEVKYSSFLEEYPSKQNKETAQQFLSFYTHQIQCFREYYYSLGASTAGLLLMGKSAAPCIDLIISCLSEEKACENPELLSAKQAIENKVRDAESQMSTEHLPYLMEFIRLTGQEERFYLFGLFVYALEKRISLQKRFLPDFSEDKELIEKLYAPILEEYIIVSKLRNDYKGLIPS